MPLLSVLDLSPIIDGGDAALAFRNTARPCAARRALGLPSLLAGGASQHSRASPARRRRWSSAMLPADVDDSRRRRRDHAAEPCAARHRRAVRHAGVALSRPDRSRPGPRAGQRSTHGPRPAPQSRAAAATLSRRTSSELQSLLRPATNVGHRRRSPATGLNVPLYLLGSSDFSARLAAELGLPFAFASHFAPDYLHVALQLYRARFPAVCPTRQAIRYGRRRTSSPPTPTPKPRGFSPPLHHNSSA